MPCPCFEPRHTVSQPLQPNARLPLIEEYDGVCHAEAEAIPVDAETRMRLCNHGNVRGVCTHFPKDHTCSSFRLEVLRRSASHIDVLFIQEAFYSPAAWRRVEFLIDGERLDPETGDVCERAQILAFCRSFLRRHPIQGNVKS
jgi:hypothetical protein